MSLCRPGETEPIHSVSYGHVAACQLIGPHTLSLRVGDSQLLLQSPQVREHGVWTAVDSRAPALAKSKLKELTFDLGESSDKQGIKDQEINTTELTGQELTGEA